jgi:hypothetical protein
MSFSSRRNLVVSDVSLDLSARHSCTLDLNVLIRSSVVCCGSQ